MVGAWARTGRMLAVAAALPVLLTPAAVARAADADLAARLRALEERIEKLERTVGEKDAEIARLRERLEQGEAPRQRTPNGRGEAIERWRNQFGDLEEGVRRQLEEMGMDWGLPGRTFRNTPGPIDLGPERRAFLGIEMDEGDRGVEVRDVVAGSPAERAGLRPGDVIVKIDGRQVFGPREVVELVGSRTPGDALTLTVERDGRTLDLSATLAEPPGGRGGRGGRRGSRGPAFRFAPFGPGLQREAPGPEAQDSMEVDVPVPGGRARVNLSAPGLFLSEELAKELKLTTPERRAVEDALAKAREGLVESIADEVGRSRDGALAAVGGLRTEAETRARELLVGKLPDAKLAALERAQARAAGRSTASMSMQSSTEADGDTGERHGERRVEDSLEDLFERAQKF